MERHSGEISHRGFDVNRFGEGGTFYETGRPSSGVPDAIAAGLRDRCDRTGCSRVIVGNGGKESRREAWSDPMRPIPDEVKAAAGVGTALPPPFNQPFLALSLEAELLDYWESQTQIERDGHEVLQRFVVGFEYNDGSVRFTTYGYNTDSSYKSYNFGVRTL